ncbi:DDE-type integrase/transposase/recombinase [Crenobacter caeni]|uniref:Transposase family protein n=1 Tax=Crenobacter caeni TaxID=2705474 RepID=A0A6B2KU50_9NEIS|nr:transposase family protein [Crenobacter caeni]
MQLQQTHQSGGVSLWPGSSPRRHGVGSLHDLEPTPNRPTHKLFKAYDPGHSHMDAKYLPQMPDKSARRYLFVAIDRTTRRVFVLIKPHKTVATARAFLSARQKAAACLVRTMLTDNGSEFTVRLFNRQKQASGEHEFDRLRASLESAQICSRNAFAIAQD